MRIVWLSIGIVLSLMAVVARAQEESLCAEVKIEILQEVAMERQGFEALMRITNSLDTFSLENVSVTVNFKDADDNPVIATSNTAASNAAFFIRVDGTRNVTGFSQGNDGAIQGGIIAPKTIGEMRWLIIPTANGAGQTQDGKLYFVGAQLKYSYGGKEEVVDVAADSIVVKPQPALTLDYFLTQEIVGDNAFTTAIEAPEPYTLGVRISNNGFGYAKAVKIESAQPTIVENKLGLAMGFKIIGSYLEDRPASPTLLINFGNIKPQGVTTGRWIMESNLAGTFTSFNASFTHADELGGALTSLLQATNANFLLRDVVVDLPGRDGLRDFLALNAQHDTVVFESEATGSTVANCTNCKSVNSVMATTTGSGATSQFTHVVQVGFSHAKAVDPYAGNKVLVKAMRMDGTSVHPQNVWLSKKRAADNINFDYFVNIFDNNSLGIYTLYWGVDVVELPQAPVIQYIPDYITYEGGSVNFAVQATDPNRTIPTLAAALLPAGAVLNLAAPNQGTFSWSPTIGQAGIYPITFTATDGTLTASRSLNIRVHPNHDTDGDGMDDAWEIEHFGDLSHDGSEDTDGDGRSDLQEFLDQTDPEVVNALPATPQILSPIFDADTLQASELPLQPTLVVTNGKHPANVGAVAIVYEVYKDESLTQLMASLTVNEGVNTTSVKIAPVDLLDGATFEDNHLYYWRAKSQQRTGATATSPWVKSQFFINTNNDAPTAPTISSPVINGVVANLNPVLSVTNATDVDRDLLSYSFVIYDENNLNTALATVSNVLPSADGQTYWHLPVTLTANKRYVWQATVTDGHGASVTSEWGSFLVSMSNAAPSIPQIDSPADGAVVQKPSDDHTQILSVLNATDPENAAVKYYFELDKVNTFDSADKKVSPVISAGAQGKTAWLVSNLIDKQVYHWRVRAFDGALYSEWNSGQFTFSHINLPPSVPALHNPGNGTIVTTLSPAIEVSPSVDPEGRAVSYHYQIFTNAQMSTLVAEKILVNPLWQVDISLANTVTYYWRVRAEDADGVASAWTDLYSFTITLSAVNQKPQFTFLLPNANTTVTRGENVFIQWTDSDDDSDAKIMLLATKDGVTTIIAAQLNENMDGDHDQYTLNTVNMAPGQYNISAQISDEENIVMVNSCCLLIIQEPIPSLLLSRWQFNENSGAQTFSSVDNTAGIFKVAPITPPLGGVLPTMPMWVPGATGSVDGSAIQFDGVGSYIELPKTITTPLLKSASMSFWLKTAQLGAGYSWNSPAIIGNELRSSGNDITWGSLGSIGSVGFSIGDSRLLSYVPINNNSWHHVVITRDVPLGSINGLVKIYVDGRLNAMGYLSDPGFNGLKNNLVGFGVANVTNVDTNNLLTSSFFEGALDDIKIFNRALTLTEVHDLYLADPGAPNVGASGVPVNIMLSNQIGLNGVYEAEAATIYYGQVAKNTAGYSGFGFLDLDANLAGYVEWVIESNVNGSVSAQIRYANGGGSDRPMSISVNGIVVHNALSMPATANWNTWATVTIVIPVHQGINTIRAKSTVSVGGPNIDYIKIQ